MGCWSRALCSGVSGGSADADRHSKPYSLSSMKLKMWERGRKQLAAAAAITAESPGTLRVEFHPNVL